MAPDRSGLAVSRQCELLGISRSGYYHEPDRESPVNLALMRAIDEQVIETTSYGSR